MESWQLAVCSYLRRESTPMFIFIPPEITQLVILFYSHSSAFPSTFQYNGYLQVRSNLKKPWKTKYFVINHNFLFCGTTSSSKQLDVILSLNRATAKTNSNSSLCFESMIRKHLLYFKTPSPKQCRNWVDTIQIASKFKIKNIYKFLYTLNLEPTKVIAAIHRETKQQSAIKIIDKKKYKKKVISKKELSILKHINHQNIVTLFEMIETSKYLYFVMERCEGGPLFDEIMKVNEMDLTDTDCCSIMHQIANGVKYMHSMGIVLRNLKPQNILCVEPCSIGNIKIADHGISKAYNDIEYGGDSIHSFYAPELFKDEDFIHSFYADYWNIGVIMYQLLCGFPPFWSDEDVVNHLNDDVNYLNDDVMYRDHVSNEVKSLERGLLDKDVFNRKSCDDILKLKWNVSLLPTIKMLKIKPAVSKETVTRTVAVKSRRNGLNFRERRNAFCEGMFFADR